MLSWDYCRAVYLHMRPFSLLWLNLAIPMIISRFLPKMHDVTTYLLFTKFPCIALIKVMMMTVVSPEVSDFLIKMITKINADSHALHSCCYFIIYFQCNQQIRYIF